MNLSASFLFSPLSLTHSLSLSPSPLLSPFNTLHFPSSLPLPPSLGSAPKQSRVGAKAQAVPCRAHMDSGVLLSRAHNVVPARRLSSRLTSYSTTTTTHNNHNPSVPALCSQAIQQTADNIVIIKTKRKKGRFGIFFKGFAMVDSRVLLKERGLM